MIERYFPEEGTMLKEIKDNQTSLSIICSNPNWDTDRVITLSDLGIARVYGFNLKDFTRPEFIEEIKRLFPMKFRFYMVRDWEFPIPLEWNEMALTWIDSAKKRKFFNAITPSVFINDVQPPLYSLYLLKKVLQDYQTSGPNGTSAPQPSDLVHLLNNPYPIFREEVITVRGE